MSSRYSIMVQEYQSDHETELLRCDSNPEPIVRALKAKTLRAERSIFEKGRRTYKIPKYVSVRVVDHGEG